MEHLYQLQTKDEEKLNGLTHGLGLVLSIVGLYALLYSASSQGFGVWLASLVYGLSLVQLFGVSTFYHRCLSLGIKIRARIWDHCAIYLLIAGSYTPLMTIALGGWRGWSVMIAVWTLAFLGIRYKCKSHNPFGVKSVLLYLFMGWLVVFVWTPLTAALAPAGLNWLIAGGVVYSLGIPFYAWQSLRYSHGIWHLFVMAGALCHFVSIFGYVL